MSQPNIVSSTITLNAGMYILRLLQQPEILGQSISINPAPLAPAGDISFFCSTGVKNNCLSNADESMIVRVDSEEAILLIAEQSEEGQPPLQLKVDKIANLSLKKEATINKIVEPTEPAKPEDICLSGHIEWQGDVQSAVGEYLGNPQSQNRIEGFTIEWQDRPDDVDIAYSCEVEQMGRTPIALSGNYVGTRQRALAIQSVSFSLVGLQAENYTLSGQAFFAGQEPLEIVSGIDAHGPTTKEQLIALQIIVTAKT